MNTRLWFTLSLAIALVVSACGASAPTSQPLMSPRQPNTIVVTSAPMSVTRLAQATAMPGAPMESAYCCSTGGTTTVNGEPYDATFFENYGVNPFIDTEDDHLSTFAMDVDTASYTVIRRFLSDGYLPDKDAVRTEEVLNYFDMRYPQPESGAFAVHLEGAPSRFGGEKHWLLRAGIQGRDIAAEARKDAVLTFVIDVSGSMAMETRLETVKQALRLLVGQLRPTDQVALVVYGTDARHLLDPTPATEADAILAAIDRLQPEGSTNAEAGLRVGYEVATRGFKEGAINRVILCSDGVANNGITSAEGILRVVSEYANRNITLSTVGFGMGNYNDVLMEQFADQGDGNYAYVDTLAEAERIFVENLTGTLQVIARDAKIQVEFNPQVVRSYRLLGYENRDVADQDFRNDQVDAGEVGAGHSVTALYEIKFQDGADAGDALMVRIRYQDPDTNEVVEQSRVLQREAFHPSFDAASPTFRLAAAVAEYAEILRKSFWAQDGDMRAVLDVARPLTFELDYDADMEEFVRLVERAVALAQ